VIQEQNGEENIPLLGTSKIISGPGDEVQPPDFSKLKIPVLSYVPKTKEGRNNLLLFVSKWRSVKHFVHCYIQNQEI
jgi:hypothetical protein